MSWFLPGLWVSWVFVFFLFFFNGLRVLLYLKNVFGLLTLYSEPSWCYMGSVLSPFLPYAPSLLLFQQGFPILFYQIHAHFQKDCNHIQMQQHVGVDYRYQCNSQSSDLNFHQFQMQGFNSSITFTVPISRRKRMTASARKPAHYQYPFWWDAVSVTEDSIFYRISNKTCGSVRTISTWRYSDILREPKIPFWVL